MENRFVNRSFRRQLDQVLLHEQVENGVTINNNLSEDQINQQFVTLTRVFQSEHKLPWKEKRPVSHKMPQVVLIIPHQVQIGETHKHIGSLQQNS